MSGYPVGSLLVYESKADDAWQLIDGLQRITAIERYQNNPLEFVDLDDLMTGSEKLGCSFSTIFKEATSQGLLGEENGSTLKQAILTWLRSVPLSSSSEYDPYSLARSYCPILYRHG